MFLDVFLGGLGDFFWVVLGVFFFFFGGGVDSVLMTCSDIIFLLLSLFCQTHEVF